MQTSNQTRLEKSLLRILDQIEQLQEQIGKSSDEEEKASLKIKLRNLGILRSYYIQLIMIKYGDPNSDKHAAR
ncbi:MAG TPA: hypothetical protein DER60_06710 [Syntrophomonas sp.]|jgi:hypothetical protein|nr:hypothetical protein [Syntrophomonas sp.]